MEKRPQSAFGWAARDASGVLSPFSFSRRATGDDDVTLKVLYCGICHTDLHTITNEWANATYPVVPGHVLQHKGLQKHRCNYSCSSDSIHKDESYSAPTNNWHEIVGTVTDVGCDVQKFKVGDKIGVGYLADSCGSCESCKGGFENYCFKIMPTFNGIYHDGSVTYGGFSDVIVVNENFAFRVPDNLPLEKTAPLLCAGTTVYSPMKHYGLNEPGKHLGVVGLGGLGHVAVKFGKAFGMKVTVISTSRRKEKEAIENLGADSFLVSSEADQMQAAFGTMDGIIDTVPASHPLPPLLFMLKAQGKMIIVGAPSKLLELPAFCLIHGGRMLAGSLVGGLNDTQEMIDFAGKHNVTADVEVVPMDYVNTAMERLAKGDVKYRFVIDVGNTLTAA